MPHLPAGPQRVAGGPSHLLLTPWLRHRPPTPGPPARKLTGYGVGHHSWAVPSPGQGRDPLPGSPLPGLGVASATQGRPFLSWPSAPHLLPRLSPSLHGSAPPASSPACSLAPFLGVSAPARRLRAHSGPPTGPNHRLSPTPPHTPQADGTVWLLSQRGRYSLGAARRAGCSQDWTQPAGRVEGGGRTGRAPASPGLAASG